MAWLFEVTPNFRNDKVWDKDMRVFVTESSKRFLTTTIEVLSSLN